MYDITYNGSTGIEKGIRVVERPNVPDPKLRATEIEIPGRDGTLIESDDTYENIEISVKLNYMTEKELWMQSYRTIKKWLLSKGSGELIFSDDPDYFYKVKHVTVGENARTSTRIGVITPTFLCDPFNYLTSGKYEYGISQVLHNPYYLSHPVYKITGEGMCEIYVNGKSMTANVGQNLTIDTELMLTYREDGTMMNTAVAGDYMDLYLQEGENEIAATEGFDVKVIPNWRCL